MCFKYVLLSGALLLTVISGCELVTDQTPKNQAVTVGKDLIIDEVFTLSPDKYYAYSWIELLNPTSRTIRWIDQSFPLTVHIAGSGGTLLRTEDDGKHWADVYDGTEDLYGVLFGYPDTGYVVGANGFIKIVHHDNVSGAFSYVDPVANPVAGTGVTLRGVAGPFITPSVYTVGDNGTVERSTDRAVHWTQQTTNTAKRLNGLYFESFTAVYAVGDSGLIMKSPRTNQWDKKIIGAAYATTNFYGIATQGAGVTASGLAVGDGGVILSTRNGGETWFPESSGVSSALRGIAFNRATAKAWVVGDNGVILLSKDTAKTWQPQVSGTTARLEAVTFYDSVKGWAVGSGGTVLFTTNGGVTWTAQESGTTQDLHSINVLPASIRIRDRLVIEMHARRNTFFFDPTAPPVPGVNPNFDFIVARDTGSVFYDPGLLADLGVQIEAPPSVPPQGWVIINSDSIRFKDHTTVGPGKPQFQNFSVSFTDTSLQRARPVLWDLLDAGEIRLIRIFRKQLLSNGETIGPQSTDVVDVVRWGNYRPDPALTPPELLYPNNEPAGFIPEWYSLSRYVNDVGGDVNTISTKASFYMADHPLPGWYSQRAK